MSSVFMNAKPVKSYFETHAQLAEYLASEERIIGVEIPLNKSIYDHDDLGVPMETPHPRSQRRACMICEWNTHLYNSLYG